MNYSFNRVDFVEIRDDVIAHLAILPSAIDSYLEGKILASNHYRIAIEGQNAGFASIQEGSSVTQFAISRPFRHHGQDLFARLRRTESVRSAFVPTCDEFFLAHALDNYQTLAKEAYLFATRDESVNIPVGFRLQPAELSDVERIRTGCGAFMDPIAERIGRGELFLTFRDDELIAFGIREMSRLYDNLGSVGMFTLQAHRGTGAGTATIALLIADSRRRGIRSVAGCWYYNHASKRTLERAGLVSSTRLLKIEF